MGNTIKIYEMQNKIWANKKWSIRLFDICYVKK